MLYIYKISFALIIINYKLILYLLLGIYSILTTRSYIIYKQFSYKNYSTKFDIVDTIYVKIISLLLISIFSLIMVVILSLPSSIISINIFIFASKGIYFNINNISIYLYYKYRIAKLPLVPVPEINELQNIWIILSILIRYISIC